MQILPKKQRFMRSMDLNQDFSKIREKLDGIAEDYVL